MPEVKRLSLVKPTLQTNFHIDFNWWRQRDSNWRVYLNSLLCPDHRAMFGNTPQDQMVDWVDPESAEVQQVDGLQHVLISHCAKIQGFITEHTTLVDAVFRLFLANGNTPLNATELGTQLGKPPDTILRTLAGGQVYRGLRPCA